MIELQRKLIGDPVRNAAFFAALSAVLRPESQVIDLGSGTGFLAFLSRKLGAKHVTCIESGEIIDISRTLARRNRIKNCTFIHAHSTDVPDLPHADVLVSETLGNYALEENIIESIEDAKRFLKPGATIIPGRIRQFVSPVTSDRIPREIDCWETGYGISFEEARQVAQNNMYVKTIRPDDLWSPEAAIQWDAIDFARRNASLRRGTARWCADGPTTIHGFALWWEADLAEGVTLSTSPYEAPTHWEQIFLPLLRPVTLALGEWCVLTLASDTRWEVKINLRWTLEHQSANGHRADRQVLDMKNGYL